MFVEDVFPHFVRAFKRMHPSPCSGYSFYDLLLGSGFRIQLCNASENCVYIQDYILTQIGHASSETPFFALLSDAVLAVTPQIFSFNIYLFMSEHGRYSLINREMPAF